MVHYMAAVPIAAEGGSSALVMRALYCLGAMHGVKFGDPRPYSQQKILAPGNDSVIAGDVTVTLVIVISSPSSYIKGG